MKKKTKKAKVQGLMRIDRNVSSKSPLASIPTFCLEEKKNQRLAHSGKHWQQQQQLAATTTINITTTTHWLVPLGSASCGGNGQGQGVVRERHPFGCDVDVDAVVVVVDAGAGLLQARTFGGLSRGPNPASLGWELDRRTDLLFR